MANHPIYGSRTLSARELRVVQLVARGLKNGEIAKLIGTTEYVVKNYVRAIYDKTGLSNRVELALWHEARMHRKEKYGAKVAIMASPVSGRPVQSDASSVVNKMTPVKKVAGSHHRLSDAEG